MADIETVYCVKYALSSGVYKVRGHEHGKYFKMVDVDGRIENGLVHGELPMAKEER